MDKINFTGGFLLKTPKLEIWEDIYKNAVPSKRNIVHDVFDEGNILFVTKTCYDKAVTSYLLDKNILFSYFPNINLHTRVGEFEVNELHKFLKTQFSVTNNTPDNVNEIRKLTADLKTNYTPLAYKWRENDQIKQSLIALDKLQHTPIDRLKHTTKNNITKFVDDQNNLVATASPNNSAGRNYIIIYPKNGSNLKMCEVDYNGNVIDVSEDIENLNNFKKNFKKAVNTDRGRKRPTI